MKKLKIIFFTLLFLIIIFFRTLGSNYFNLDNNINPSLLKVHFIDVGQGDCILIQSNNINILVDSGPKESQKQLLNYLDKLNISTLNYVIATHPHEDHIDNMSSLIYRYNIDYFYAPKVSVDSKSFEQMVEALLTKNLKINIVNSETLPIYFNDDFYIEFLSPPKNFDDDNLNLYSAIFKLTFKDISFLFTGDAEVDNEIFLTSQYPFLTCDVLKVGHHGSETSTTSNFLKSIKPSIAIISCGQDNLYNHPSPNVLSLLEDNNIITYRTDILGDIVIISDGKSLYKENTYK